MNDFKRLEKVKAEGLHITAHQRDRGKRDLSIQIYVLNIYFLKVCEGILPYPKSIKIRILSNKKYPSIMFTHETIYRYK